MFKKILLAYDGSEDTAAALHQSAEIARLFEAEIHIIGIIKTSGTALHAEPYGVDRFLKARWDHIEAELSQVGRDLEKQGLKVTINIQEGYPSDHIGDYARSIEADLVVLGHTEKSLVARWFEGSVGSSLVRNPPCSLLIATD